MSAASEHQLPPQFAGLWPPPATMRKGRSTHPDQDGYVVLPSLRRPRMLVPLGAPGADRMFSRYAGGRAERTLRLIWRLAQQSHVATRLPLTRFSVAPDPDGIEAFLASVLGRPVRIGVLLGPPRANLKPVIQIFDGYGDTVAFAKLGMTPLTALLVDNEASTLAMLEDRTTHTFTAPRRLHDGPWHDIPVLVQQALTLSQSNRAPVEPPVAVMAEIAAIAGISVLKLRDSDFLARTRPTPQAGWHGIDMLPFVRLHAALESVADCPFGSWHGDFGPWNMGSAAARVEVWDWERFEAGVPAGFDAAHYRTQVEVAARTEPEVAWRQITADVAAVLDELGLSTDSATAVAGCYLLAISARYRTDPADNPTSALLCRMKWLAASASVAIPQVQETVA